MLQKLAFARLVTLSMSSFQKTRYLQFEKKKIICSVLILGLIIVMIVIILIFFSNSIVMVVMGHLRAENTYFPTSPRPAPNLYPTPSFLERNLHHLHLHRCNLYLYIVFVYYSILFYIVTMLLCYYVTMLLCYYVTQYIVTQSCIFVITQSVIIYIQLHLFQKEFFTICICIVAHVKRSRQKKGPGESKDYEKM